MTLGHFQPCAIPIQRSPKIFVKVFLRFLNVSSSSVGVTFVGRGGIPVPMAPGAVPFVGVADWLLCGVDVGVVLLGVIGVWEPDFWGLWLLEETGGPNKLELDGVLL